MRAKFDPIYSVEVDYPVPPRRKLYTPGTKVSDMDPCRDRYSRERICVLVTLSTPFLAPNEGTEKSRAKGTVLCVRGFVFLGVCCLFEIGAGLSRVSMPHWVIACSSIRGAPTVFKCVWHVLDATLDQPGTAMPSRPRPGANACTVSTRSGAVCVRGFVCSWSVLPVSDWCRAVQCPHATLGERL